jgi:hypothetical protein
MYAQFLSENLKGRIDHFENLSPDWRIILNVTAWTGLKWLRIGSDGCVS